MALSSQKIREILFQFLYSYSFEKEEEDSALFLLMRQHKITKTQAIELKAKADQIWQFHEEFDQRIQMHLKGYEFGRIGSIEKAVLRLGIYEIYHSDLPPKVVIAEAIRLSKKYATKESISFVNALLDAIEKEKERALISNNQVPC